jgi:virginiamycin B lyase
MVITTDGNAWFSGSLAPNAIGRMTPAGVVAYSVTGAASGSSVSVGPLMLASDGKIWFCDPSGGSALQGAITSIVPATGVSVSYQPTGPIPIAGTPTPSGITAGAQAYAIAQSSDGKFWFSELSGRRIGQFDPVLNTAVEYGPLQSRATFLATGPDGAVWFAENLSTTSSILGRIATYVVTTTVGLVTTTTTQVRITEFSSQPIDGNIAGLTTGADGKLWFIKNGFGGAAVGKMDPATNAVTLYTGLTGVTAQLGAIVPGPDGNLWFTDYAQGLIGRVTPAGAITEFSSGATNPLFNTMAAGRASDALHRVWFTRPGDDMLGEISLP